MTTQDVQTCEKCDSPTENTCLKCKMHYCHDCFIPKHLTRHPSHASDKEDNTSGSSLAWIVDTASKALKKLTRKEQFQRDEHAKWFGLHIQKPDSKKGPHRVTTLVETRRLQHLLGMSIDKARASGRQDALRQFPSTISFIGEAGVGKSTLIRSLIHHASNPTDFSDNLDDLEAPIAGTRLDGLSRTPTTGEVNLYADPKTLGTVSPLLFADCEGINGGQPAAAEHQDDWFNHGTKYELQSRNGRPIDRISAVDSIYPRCLYLFSDVICMVTRSSTTWAKTVIQLLEWSQIGAHNTVNQSALPALIIVLNAPSDEDKSWLSSEQDGMTRAFFENVRNQLDESPELRKLADKNEDKTMKELFLRHFSSVFVHCVPLKSFGELGNSQIIMQQLERLGNRVRHDSQRVQAERARTWSLFDGKQLAIIIDYAFRHIASGTEMPFDLSQCRKQVELPTTMEGHIAEFLSRCMYKKVETNFTAAAAIVGSCAVRHALKSDGSVILHPSSIFDNKFKEICHRAVDQFLSNTQPCTYVHSENGKSCINVRHGHAKGHQAGDGSFLSEGGFMAGEFNVEVFLDLIDRAICTMLKDINNSCHADGSKRSQYAANLHRLHLQSLPDQSFWMESFEISWLERFNSQFSNISGARLTARASVCYACLHGRPEYYLPCSHVKCSSCIRDFDETQEDERYPGISLHYSCILCSSSGGQESPWPYIGEYVPDLGGVRVLTLDGGGVRGIIPLTVLQCLEKRLGSDIQFNRFFDLMVGSSTGGTIALGLGIHNFTVGEFILKFKQLFETGLEKEAYMGVFIIGWLRRHWGTSIYKTEPLEKALRDIFGQKRLFGHPGTALRVAVTTSVQSKSRLFANYNWGNGEDYLNSSIYTWHAARCTSAAPMYFEPVRFEGSECLDGGLCEDSLIQSSRNQARAIWGNDISFDLIASLGCGWAQKRQSVPSFWLAKWVGELFIIFLIGMDFKAQWEDYERKFALDRTRQRTVRLDIGLDCHKEPDLDDVAKIPWMEKQAQLYKFHHERSGAYDTGVHEHVSQNELDVVADRLFGSLYFFEMSSLSKEEDVSVIHGWICCRHPPHGNTYETLISRTVCFVVNGKKEYFKTKPKEGERVKLPVSFREHDGDRKIRIDVQFEAGARVTISGFPVTLTALTKYWESR